MTRSLHPDEPRVISIAINLDNEWTPEEYLEVLYLRLPRANGIDERERIRAKIDTVETCFLGRAPDNPAWLRFREQSVC